MLRFLPILLMLFIFCFLIVKPVNAQENVDTSNVSAGLTPQGGIEDFLNKILSNRLDNINKASLPFEVGESIVPAGVKKDDKQSLKDDILKRISGYTVTTGMSLPWEIHKVSLNLSDYLSGIVNSGKTLFGFGNEVAKEWAAETIPDIDNVVNSVQTQKFNTEQNTIAQNTSNSTNVLGSAETKTTNQDKMMDISLPLVECANLPFVLCQDKLYK